MVHMIIATYSDLLATCNRPDDNKWLGIRVVVRYFTYMKIMHDLYF